MEQFLLHSIRGNDHRIHGLSLTPMGCVRVPWANRLWFAGGRGRTTGCGAGTGRRHRAARSASRAPALRAAPVRRPGVYDGPPRAAGWPADY